MSGKIDPSVDARFTHMVEGTHMHANGARTVYMIGTWSECKTWQVVNHMVARTRVIPS